MRERKYIIIGDPIPWARARLRGKVFFDAQANIKLNIGLSFLQQQG